MARGINRALAVTALRENAAKAPDGASS